MFRYSLIAILVTTLGLASCSFDKWGRTPSSAEGHRKIVLGIDGLGYNSFKYAQDRLGLFKRFNSQSKHISTFPSISDYVWNTLVRAKDVFGDKGRLKYFETAYFDEYTGRVDSDPRNYLIQSANPYHYTRAFPYQYNVFKEVVGYQSVDVLLKGEFKSVEEQIIASEDDLIPAFIVGFDSISHLHKEYTDVALHHLDAMVEKIYKHHVQLDPNVEIIIVADHDLVGRFALGDEEIPLKEVDVQATLSKVGFKPVTHFSGDRLEAVPAILALANYVPLYFADHSMVSRYVKSIRNKKWLQLATYRKHYRGVAEARDAHKREVHVIIENGKGKASVIFDKATKKYVYKPIKGNPLGYDRELFNLPMDETELFEKTINYPMPDAVFRVIQSADGSEIDYPDLILSFNDEYMTKGGLGGMVTMYKTHGSIGDGVSIGLVATSKDDRELPEYVRTKDVLDTIAISPRELFNVGGFVEERDDLESSFAKSWNPFASKMIATGMEKEHPQRNADYLTKAIAHSKYIFDIDKLSDIVMLDDTNPEKYELVFNFDSDLQSKSFLAGDQTLEIESIDKGEYDKMTLFQKMKNKVVTIFEKRKHKFYMDLRQFTQSTKTAVTTIYSIPYFAKRFFARPDESEIEDTRNEDAARNWRHVTDTREPMKVLSPEDDSHQRIVRYLFQNVFTEQKLVERVYPERFPLHYPTYPTNDVTVVFVPGIYDTIFDGTIFRPAMDGLNQLLGLRVIKGDVVSTCSSRLNGRRLIEQLKKDRKTRIQRGFPEPRYVLLGYSKGGLDSLFAFANDGQFVKDHILALVTIASPLHGASIADNMGMPRFAVDAMSFEVTPKICRTTDVALDSLKPAARIKFWKENEAKLKGLTKYFSITFKTGVMGAHPWMKATKLLAQYDEKNDGVVEISSSKFPKTMNAFDLGTLEGDHLSGFVTSEFQQVAFAKSIMITLTELGITPKDEW